MDFSYTRSLCDILEDPL